MNAPSTRGLRPRVASRSIALRLGLLLTLVLAIAVAAVVFATFRYGRSAADQAFDRLLTGAALQIGERVSVVDGKPVVDVPLSAFELLALARDDRIFYRVIGPHGKTLTGYDDLPLPPTAPAGASPRIYETPYRDTRVRAIALSRDLAERSLSGRVEIIVAHTMLARTALAREIAMPAIAGIALASLAILALTLLAMRYALRPLRRIERAMLARDPRDLTPFHPDAPREVATLVDAINRFMGRLDRRLDTMERFVADAAHQMRTPVTALRAQSELAIEETDPERLRALQGRIRSRAIGISRLMDQLLSHALVTHRVETVELAALDLRRVAIEAEREIRSAGVAQAELLHLDLSEDPVIAAGDAFSLREAAKNLIANALRYGAPPITLRVEHSKDHASIVVHDEGGGFDLPADEVGTRFARHENTPESAGLGLAIVREVVESHQGELTVTRPVEGGFAIGILLPALDEERMA
ncbi:sensor histidine kinase [Pararhizobium mangrovi]|uniref:histidine kinase n=1 Tax=Pararhizobium mangrovi TaxID=2590452 RepID=A0A506U323_9HYPH|nr:sensor histidine kinase [Pararhizobium mangrovi]TPW26267.1 sensor histidine kinase [Pararhizobium mangrovi]